ncbi:LysR family transcriptional regulator [Hoyosella altamirensis]|uniref:DNA-binding transcriptional LysR family regulator n=1 Tax=Hoyosella altamirensis TaxID=616997 RepID=A0A839RQD4_9ACTN|nr:LysR family transcriptional regulator [Hoyosella altamirensis]MBB3038529.1 DNA-binding transcriptional LysR family regulator [Hoyosella altamirensis]
MLDVHRLSLLRELSIRGTISEVAAAMSYSPSSVSQQLSILEREAGVVLLRKSGRRLQLTPQAVLLVDHATELLDCLERAEAALAASSVTVTGTVRLAVFQTAALALIPQALQLLRERHAKVRIEMVQHEPETALHETWARDFDLVVAEQYPGHAAPHYAGLDRQLLTGDAIRLALPPVDGAAADFSAVSGLDAASELPWVMEPSGSASRHWAEQACRQAGFEPDVRFETADLQAHVRLVESGNAVAFLPDLVWVGREPHARLLGLEGDPRRTIFTAIRASSARHPAVRAIRSALEETARDLASFW